MHIIEIDEKDYDIQFQYGQFNRNYPNPISEREYVLDYTCRCFESKNFNEIIDTVDHMHKIIYNLFEKCIGEGLRGEMR